jgi:hypothetical protein
MSFVIPELNSDSLSAAMGDPKDLRFPSIFKVNILSGENLDPLLSDRVKHEQVALIWVSGGHIIGALQSKASDYCGFLQNKLNIVFTARIVVPFVPIFLTITEEIWGKLSPGSSSVH